MKAASPDKNWKLKKGLSRHLIKKPEYTFEESLVESRFPKLIYAYQKFFKILIKLKGESDFQELKEINEDIFVRNKSHSLARYEIILKQVTIYKFTNN